MPERIYADIQALKDLRQALLDFARRQKTALERAQTKVAQTLEWLAERDRYWQREVKRRRTAYERCRSHRDEDGRPPPCTAELRAWQDAETELANVRRWRTRIEAVVAEYRQVAARLQRLLEGHIPRSTTFLASKITDLEAYRAAQALATAVRLSQSLGAPEVSSLIGGVVGALSWAQGELSRVLGAIGEEIGAQVVAQEFRLEEVPFDQPKHGFDRVFRAPGVPLIVMESKVRSSGTLHLRQTQAGQQGSPEWLAATAEKMTDPSSAQWSPANERIGRLVQELGPGNVPVLTAVTNPQTGMVDIYYRRGKSDWLLLRGGFALERGE